MGRAKKKTVVALMRIIPIYPKKRKGDQMSKIQNKNFPRITRINTNCFFRSSCFFFIIHHSSFYLFLRSSSLPVFSHLLFFATPLIPDSPESIARKFFFGTISLAGSLVFLDLLHKMGFKNIVENNLSAKEGGTFNAQSR